VRQKDIVEALDRRGEIGSTTVLCVSYKRSANTSSSRQWWLLWKSYHCCCCCCCYYYYY